MKYLSLIKRRRDFSAEAFRNYYENQHVPLALSFFPPQLYRRNYPVPDVELAVDCLCEFAYPDGFDIEAAMGTTAGPALAEDEGNFIERDSTRTAQATLLCGEPAPSRSLARREFWLIPHGDAESESLQKAFQGLPVAIRDGACLEALQPFWCDDFPYAALLSLEAVSTGPLPAKFAALGAVRVRVDSCASQHG
ncbi:EthD domain-containing protein [Pseudomonas saudiphocaensis]|uniref:EthD protein n=1 Tax=Pseudomonas saudiphocaensis TaxID=1499686 RepID=A0A078M074_9PSED|nr:EthD domain-containing protein [Pseudomonas saudiphocaensis]CDZ96057.1 EthD protein [Pseudomonas saudiphocaensis]